MLTFEQLDRLPNRVSEIWSDVQRAIIDDMARRIAALLKITESTAYQVAVLTTMDELTAGMREMLAAALDLTDREIERLFTMAAEYTLEYDDAIHIAAGGSPTAFSQNPGMQQIIAAGIEKTKGSFFNLTGTTAATADGIFEDILDRAYARVLSGAFDYQSSLSMAVRELTDEKVFAITYPSGHKDFIDVAVRRAVLTGIAQTAGKVQEYRMREMHCHYVEVSAHAGARPSHAVWQGRLYFWAEMGGTNTMGFPDFVSSTQYGEMLGLCGINCRHSFYPFYPGISDKAFTEKALKNLNEEFVTYNGEKMTLYDALQKQRKIERTIRYWKRRASASEAGGLENDAAFANRKVREWQAKMRDFLEQTGLDRDYFRERGGNQI